MQVITFTVCLLAVVFGATELVGQVVAQNAAQAFATVQAEKVGSEALQNAIDKAAFVAALPR